MMKKSKFNIDSLQKSYGIYGTKKLLIYSGEHLVVTSELSLLLQHCEIDNIILKLILDISIRLGNELGDHSMTSYMITSTMLNTLLKPDLMHSIQLNHCSAVRSIHRIIQATHEMQLQIEEMLFLSSMITNKVSEHMGDTVDKVHSKMNLYRFKYWCKCICKHIISPATGESISDALSYILCKWICNELPFEMNILSFMEEIRRKCDQVLKYPDLYILHSIHSVNLVDSNVCCATEYIIDGRLLLSKIKNEKNNTHALSAPESISKTTTKPTSYRFVCIRYLSAGSSQNEMSEDESAKCNISVEINNKSSIGIGCRFEFENNSTLICARLVEYLNRHPSQIDLMILCEKLSPEAVTICTSNGIHVVDGVSIKYYTYLTSQLSVGNNLFGYDTAHDFMHSMDTVDGMDMRMKLSYGILNKFHSISLSGKAIDPSMVRLVGVGVYHHNATLPTPPKDCLSQLVLCSGSNNTMRCMYTRLILKCLGCMSNTIVNHIYYTPYKKIDSDQMSLPLLVSGCGNVEMMWSMFMHKVFILLTSCSLNGTDTLHLKPHETDCNSTRVAKLFTECVYSKIINKQDVLHTKYVCWSICKGYEVICMNILQNRLNEISIHDNKRKNMLNMVDWRHAIASDKIFHIGNMSSLNLNEGNLSWNGNKYKYDCLDMITDTDMECESGICWYPLHSFWRLFYNTLDTVSMIMKLGDSQYSIIYTHKQSNSSSANAGTGSGTGVGSREIHMNSNRISVGSSSIRSSLYDNCNTYDED